MTVPPQKNHNRAIAKNTFFLYIRMCFSMIIKFYTTRVLLEVLGIDDYGVWNVVYGVVIAFSFISTPLTTSTQRFLNYDQGTGAKQQTQIFSTSLFLTLIVSLILVVFLETCGSWFVLNKLNYSHISSSSVYIVYQCCIFILFLSFIRLPFEALIISHEKFSFYAFISVFESVLMLIAILILKFYQVGIPIRLYGYLSLGISLILWLIYFLYSKKHFKEVRITRKIDKSLLKDMINFSGWNLFGSVSSMSANQGINVLLNIFCGATVNAAYGISNQVKGAFTLLSNNLVKAANPQLVRSYATGEIDKMMNITSNISKISFFLIFVICFIVINFIQYILSIWLGDNIPKYSGIFCILAIVQILIVCLVAPIDTVIFSTGNIKKYQITLSALIFLDFVFSYIFLKCGFSPISVIFIKCIVESLVLIARIIFVKINIGFPIKDYFKRIILPSFLLVIVSCFIMALFKLAYNFQQNLKDLLIFSIIYLPLISLLSLFIYLNKKQRVNLKISILHKLYENRKI